jgi:LPS sulfotransferase NodH
MGIPAKSLLDEFQENEVGKSCTIAFSPRCGSTVLCNTLTRFGAGMLTEYFQYPYSSNRYLQAQNGGSILDQFRHLVLNYVSNGIFGSKMTHDHRAHLDGHLRWCLEGYRSIGDVLPDHKWIFIRRKDTVAQAVSWYVAETTNRWHSSVGDEDVRHEEVDYDFFGILSRLMIIGANNANWESYFAILGVAPHVVTYEDLVSDPSAEISLILRFLEISQNVSDVVLERDGRLKPISKHSSAVYRSLKDKFVDDFMKIGQSNDRDRLGPSLDKWNSFFFQSEWRDI